MPTVAVIQARTGSTRLPGKVMYPLDGTPVLAHVVERVAAAAEAVDRTVVATSTEPPNEVIEATATRAGADVVRGSETDVLGRFERVVEEYDPDVLVRVTADCPLLSPAVLDRVVERLQQLSADYSSNILERTFPRGLDVEAFTADSFATVAEEATEPHHREHVTPYYHEQAERFDRVSVTSREVFDEEWLHERTDLRLTLDEPADYELLRRVYAEVAYDGLLDVRDAIRHVDEHGLDELNAHVEQKET
jgi:spore coat polysaccharide biosynthesis protein SpsF